jgi:glutamate-1-semialdehyde 2,1-aminomutase
MILAIVQARMGSTRLPGKVLKKLNGKTLIEIIFHRLSLSEKIDKIILATSHNSENDLLAIIVENIGFEVFCGSEDDVLDRYYQAAKLYSPETVVRITGDCPIIDPWLLDEVIALYQENDVDYVSNREPPTFPDGLDMEVFSFAALETAYEQAKKPFEREHVTPFLCTDGQFKRLNYTNETDLSGERWTVDNSEDFEVINNVFNYFKPNIDFTWRDVLELKQTHSEYFEANKNLPHSLPGIKRNEEVAKGIGQKLWKRAKKIIPGGNMFLSKRAEMFLPENWPAYFSKAKGCKVWDLNENEYTDMCFMGIGTNILGYANDEIDSAVKKIIKQGNTSTLNCPEEVYLAEKLVELHPWADMVRFARTGGEACTIAVRIARAASGKDKVAFCGYHGWHDWYLSANLSEDSNLDGHLLPGLEPNGVPRDLKETAIPFNYNKIEELEAAIRNQDIGVIIMEVIRNQEPADNFLQKVRDLATDHNIVLIFDEITSGFRQNYGGIHLTYSVNPDMAIFGKALGNGYAISAVIGKYKIMEHAQNTFISSSYWTERIGPSAALKTIEVMKREKSWEKITTTGKTISKRWQTLAGKYELPIEIGGLPALVNFNIPVDNWLKYKTLITQEMLKKGFLAANSVYICTEHTNEIIDEYFEELDPVIAIVSECENGRNVDELLEGPVCHAGFKRLN